MARKYFYSFISLILCLSLVSCAAEWQPDTPPHSLPTQAPQQVALLVPLQGPLAHSGQAIRNGFFTAFYQQNQKEKNPITIRIYDSSQGDIRTTYQHAIEDGADFVVGPLDKKNVKRLDSYKHLSRPTLALNRVNGFWHPNKSLIQFDLSPQEEAEQVALKALSDQHQQALLIVPDTEWGNHSAKAFNKVWQDQGGTVVGQLRFKSRENLNAKLKDLLQVNTEITPNPEDDDTPPVYRRQDVDMIFLSASAEKARQIIPLLRYYYAGNIPVYATSMVYAGTPNPQANQDLNGVIFCDMPWVLQSRRLQKRSSMSLPRLYALGADAYYIATHLHQGHINAQGYTGYLRLRDQHIERTLSFATFKRGVATPYSPRTGATV